MTDKAPSFSAARTDTDQPVVDLTKAPLPTPKTVKRRQSLPYQLTRFAAFNIRIMRMVLKGDH